MLKSAGGFACMRASTFGFRVMAWVCFGQLHQTRCVGNWSQEAAWDCYLCLCKVKVSVAKIENQFLLNILSLLRPFDTKFIIWIAYIKWQLGIATQVYVIKVNVTVAEKEKNDAVCECCLDIWESRLLAYNRHFVFYTIISVHFDLLILNCMYVAYIKVQTSIATQISGIFLFWMSLFWSKMLGSWKPVFSSPEHKVLKVSFCDGPLSVVHRPCVRQQFL